MFTIGDFANLGRVSVRMLRHYDAIGLLRPARVDPSSGYRYYTAAQLSVLNRVLALKDLGFTLQQVQSIVDDKVGTGEMRGMLRLRRAQLASAVAEDSARLARVDARLRLIETEGHMTTEDVILKSTPAIRVVELSAPAAGYEAQYITESLSPLYPQLMERMAAAGVKMSGAPLAYYLAAPTGPGDESITVHAAFPVTGDPSTEAGFDVVELPGFAQAATMIHRGSMAEAYRTGQTMAQWIDDNGYRIVGSGYGREIYLDCPPGEYDKWITELQIEVAPAG
jgi:DNA-binding transcriptional MerR regulator